MRLPVSLFGSGWRDQPAQSQSDTGSPMSPTYSRGVSAGSMTSTSWRASSRSSSWAWAQRLEEVKTVLRSPGTKDLPRVAKGEVHGRSL